VDKTQDHTTAAGDSVNLDGWRAELQVLFATRVGPLFARREPRAAAKAMLVGLLSGLERKNGWWLAEHAGHARPDAMQRLLRTARWDDRELIGQVRGYVVEQFGAADGVLVCDETGFAKKGIRSAGVARQYSGTLGRVDNCQVGVFLGYASSRGHALIDRRLYLPKTWTSDPARYRQAGIPLPVRFATKPQLAAEMIDDALDAGVPAAWATADEVYGNSPAFAARLRTRGIRVPRSFRTVDLIRFKSGMEGNDARTAEEVFA
jgi:SRSO17 transposase